jgi:hypothetical protein
VFQAALVAWSAPLSGELSAREAEDLVRSGKAIIFVENDEYCYFDDAKVAGQTVRAAVNAYGNEGKMALQAWTGAIGRLETMQKDSMRVKYLSCYDNGLRFTGSQVLAPNFIRSVSACMQPD